MMGGEGREGHVQGYVGVWVWVCGCVGEGVEGPMFAPPCLPTSQPPHFKLLVAGGGGWHMVMQAWLMLLSLLCCAYRVCRAGGVCEQYRASTAAWGGG